MSRRSRTRAGWMARWACSTGWRSRARSAAGIDVAAWADEEGHFGSFIGSRSFCGAADGGRDRRAAQPRGHDAARRAGAGRASPVVRAPWSIRRAIAATSRRISSRATNWKIPASVSASSPHCRQPPLPHRVRGRAEPRRHHAHGDPQGCRRGTGESGACDRAAVSRSRGPAHRVDDRTHHAGSRARRASCRAVPRWCSSSATPIRRCWRSWRRAGGTGGRGESRAMQGDDR